MARKCRFYGGGINPETDTACEREAYLHANGVILCRPHYDATFKDEWKGVVE